MRANAATQWHIRERWLLLPPLLFIAVFLAYPLIEVIAATFTSSHGVFDNYASALSDRFFREAVLRTIVICALVSVSTLIIGFPVAYEVTRAERPGLHRAVMFAIFGALWLSILVRSYTWLLLLQGTGAVNHLLLTLGLVSKPLKLARNNLGVYIGMTHILLPFMVVTLIPTLRSIPASYLNAAAGLGASRFQTFRRVVLPLAAGGIVSGLLLTFILGLGFFITPQILGDPSGAFVSQIIAREINHLRNFNQAAAMSVMFTILVTTLYLVATSLSAGGGKRSGDSH